MECKWARNFTVAGRTLKIFQIRNGVREVFVLDTRCEDASFEYRHHRATYTALDGGNPAAAMFTNRDPPLSWGEFLRKLETQTHEAEETFQGELSVFILGDTLRIIYEDEDGVTTMACRFRVTLQSML